jgi:hypothetical protein
MMDVGGWPLAGGGLLGAAVAAVHLVHMWRTYLVYRMRLHVERERSARAKVRTAGLVRIVGDGQVPLRMQERDCDGRRIIEFGGNSHREAA